MSDYTELYPGTEGDKILTEELINDPDLRKIQGVQIWFGPLGGPKDYVEHDNPMPVTDAGLLELLEYRLSRIEEKMDGFPEAAFVTEDLTDIFEAIEDYEEEE